METTQAIQNILKLHDPSKMIEAILHLLKKEVLVDHPKWTVEGLVNRASYLIEEAEETQTTREAQEAQTNAEFFWKVVDFINWGQDYESIQSNSERMKRRLLKTFPTTQVLGLQDKFNKLSGVLYHAVEKWEKENRKECGLGDDGFGDLLGHVIGCGKEEYEACLADPSLVYARAQSWEFGESFSYCLPWEDDLAKLSLAFFKTWAVDLHEKWSEELVNSPEKEKVLNFLDNFVQTEDVPGFLEAAPEIEKILGALKDGYGRSANEWALKNLVSDVRNWLGEEE